MTLCLVKEIRGLPVLMIKMLFKGPFVICTYMMTTLASALLIVHCYTSCWGI